MFKAYHFLKTRFSTLIEYRHMAWKGIKEQLSSFFSYQVLGAIAFYIIMYFKPILLLFIIPISLVVFFLLMLLNDFHGHIEYLKKHDAKQLERDKKIEKSLLTIYSEQEIEREEYDD